MEDSSDDPLKLKEKSWADYFKDFGADAVDDEPEDAIGSEDVSGEGTSGTSKTSQATETVLPAKDAVIFGFCPQTDPLVLVKCERCNKIIKREALRSHIDRQHNAKLMSPRSDFSQDESSMPCSPSSSAFDALSPRVLLPRTSSLSDSVDSGPPVLTSATAAAAATACIAENIFDKLAVVHSLSSASTTTPIDSKPKPPPLSSNVVAPPPKLPPVLAPASGGRLVRSIDFKPTAGPSGRVMLPKVKLKVEEGLGDAAALKGTKSDSNLVMLSAKNDASAKKDGGLQNVRKKPSFESLSVKSTASSRSDSASSQKSVAIKRPAQHSKASSPERSKSSQQNKKPKLSSAKSSQSGSANNSNSEDSSGYYASGSPACQMVGNLTVRINKAMLKQELATGSPGATESFMTTGSIRASKQSLLNKSERPEEKRKITKLPLQNKSSPQPQTSKPFVLPRSPSCSDFSPLSYASAAGSARKPSTGGSFHQGVKATVLSGGDLTSRNSSSKPRVIDSSPQALPTTGGTKRVRTKAEQKYQGDSPMLPSSVTSNSSVPSVSELTPLDEAQLKAAHINQIKQDLLSMDDYSVSFGDLLGPVGSDPFLSDACWSNGPGLDASDFAILAECLREDIGSDVFSTTASLGPSTSAATNTMLTSSGLAPQGEYTGRTSQVPAPLGPSCSLDSLVLQPLAGDGGGHAPGPGGLLLKNDPFISGFTPSESFAVQSMDTIDDEHPLPLPSFDGIKMEPCSDEHASSTSFESTVISIRDLGDSVTLFSCQSSPPTTSQWTKLGELDVAVNELIPRPSNLPTPSKSAFHRVVTTRAQSLTSSTSLSPRALYLQKNARISPNHFIRVRRKSDADCAQISQQQQQQAVGAGLGVARPNSNPPFHASLEFHSYAQKKAPPVVTSKETAIKLPRILTFRTKHQKCMQIIRSEAVTKAILHAPFVAIKPAGQDALLSSSGDANRSGVVASVSSSNSGFSPPGSQGSSAQPCGPPEVETIIIDDCNLDPPKLEPSVMPQLLDHHFTAPPVRKTSGRQALPTPRPNILAGGGRKIRPTAVYSSGRTVGDGPRGAATVSTSSPAVQISHYPLTSITIVPASLHRHHEQATASLSSEGSSSKNSPPLRSQGESQVAFQQRHYRVTTVDSTLADLLAKSQQQTMQFSNGVYASQQEIVGSHGRRGPIAHIVDNAGSSGGSTGGRFYESNISSTNFEDQSAPSGSKRRKSGHAAYPTNQARGKQVVVSQQQQQNAYGSANFSPVETGRSFAFPAPQQRSKSYAGTKMAPAVMINMQRPLPSNDGARGAPGSTRVVGAHQSMLLLDQSASGYSELSTALSPTSSSSSALTSAHIQNPHTVVPNGVISVATLKGIPVQLPVDAASGGYLRNSSSQQSQGQFLPMHHSSSTPAFGNVQQNQLLVTVGHQSNAVNKNFAQSGHHTPGKRPLLPMPTTSPPLHHHHHHHYANNIGHAVPNDNLASYATGSRATQHHRPAPHQHQQLISLLNAPSGGHSGGQLIVNPPSSYAAGLRALDPMSGPAPNISISHQELPTSPRNEYLGGYFAPMRPSHAAQTAAQQQQSQRS